MIAEALRRRRVTQAHDAARALYAAGARRVWLFGSLARGGSSDSCTDLDFAVEGLDEARRQRASDSLRAWLRCKVDVVRLESAPPALKRAIEDCRVPLSANGATLVELAPAVSGLRGAAPPRPIGLHQQRMQTVAAIVRESGFSSVIDFGCGGGLLLEQLAEDQRFRRLVGVDKSPDALGFARQRLARPMATDTERISLLCALATNPDPRFLGFHAAVAVEFIEHLDESLLEAFRRVLFSFVRPALIVITTPNADYNVHLSDEGCAARRHPDHRFEWTRPQFHEWVGRACAQAGYVFSLTGVGGVSDDAGQPTQLAVCRRRSIR